MRKLISVLLLAACNTPGPHFRGLPATTVTIDGSTFDVRVNGRLAEALRTNTEYAPVLAQSGIAQSRRWNWSAGAMSKRFGETSLWLRGFWTVARAAPPVDHLTPLDEYECFTIDSYISAATQELVLDIDCTLV